MVSTLHNPCGGHLALDFVNSTDRGPSGLSGERLGDYAALLRWSREAGSLSPDEEHALASAAEACPAGAHAVLERARALREALFELFHGEASGAPSSPDALPLLNRELEHALAHTRVTHREDGWRYTLADGAELDRPLWLLARAAAELLVRERPPIKVCDSASCLWLFLDRSRNRRRRWCEMEGCGNRAKVRRHRRRRRADAEGDAAP